MTMGFFGCWPHPIIVLYKFVLIVIKNQDSSSADLQFYNPIPPLSLIHLSFCDVFFLTGLAQRWLFKESDHMRFKKKKLC